MSSLRIPQIVRVASRRFGTSSARPIKAEETRAFKKLKQDQETFNNGLGPEEVFLQGGLKDLLLYRTTVFGTISCCLWSFKVIYELAQK